MPRIRRHALVLLLIVSILTTSLASLSVAATPAHAQAVDEMIVDAWPPGVQIAYTVDPSAGTWAVTELEAAYDYGLTYPAVMNQFGLPITREEFCTIVVLLYEKLAGTTVVAGGSPFTDTNNPEIIKAAQLGIVMGMGEGLFMPTRQISRQDLTVMILRALRKALPELDDRIDGPFPFVDAAAIGPWAQEAMRFCYRNGIMNGVGGDRIDPTSNTTREQAIVLLKRTYEKYSDEIAQEPTDPTGPTEPQLPPGAPQLVDGTVQISSPGLFISRPIDRFAYQDWSARLGDLSYDTKLDLYAATEAGRPSSLPAAMLQDPLGPEGLAVVDSYEIALLTDDALALLVPIKPIEPIVPIEPAVDPVWLLPRPVGPVYSKTPYASFVDRSGDQQRWFAFSLKSAGVAKVVWQVAKGPFDGFSKDGWRAPAGLVKSGEVSATAREFVIDFATVAAADDAHSQLALALLPVSPGLILTSAREIPRAQRTYYVRAVPVNSLGQPVGDPGPGLEVLYGKALAPTNEVLSQRPASSALWAPMHQGMPTSGGEWPNEFSHVSMTRGYDPTSGGGIWVQPRGYDAATTQLMLQVATKPFTTSVAGWDQPAGLVYSKSYQRPVTVLASYPDAVNVPFNSFGVALSALKADEYLRYYVRVVALRPANVAGAVDPSFSETITVHYGFASPVKWYTPVDVIAKTYIPSVRIVEYQPVQWQDATWTQYYEVFRQPAWNEINCRWRNVQTGVVLYPFANYLMTNPSATVQWYEQEMIPQVLQVGTKVRIVPPNDDDKSWWGQLWDGIVSFFESTWEITKSLTTWVVNSYNGFKASLIDWVASQLPIPGLKTALEWAANYGLMWCGLPPTLPNFDQLTSMSVDYLAQVALTEAGMVPEDMTYEMMRQTGVAIGSQMVAAANHATANPVDAPFLKADPRYLYRPAWIEVEISNPYDKPSRPGSLNVDVEWEWRENVIVTHETWAHLPLDQQYASGLQYLSHFLYGLKRGHSGYPVWYPVFEPVRGYPIPVLRPKQSVKVRIYLKEFIGQRYPFALQGETVLGEDFANLYWGNAGDVKFSASTVGYDLPDARTLAMQQGHMALPGYIYTYRYDWTGSGYTFTGAASTAHQR